MICQIVVGLNKQNLGLKLSYNVTMDLTNIEDLKIALKLSGHNANKGLGQHFLVDKDSLNKVVESGQLEPSDTVVEIGPGLGVMTTPLTERVSKVIAVELDEKLAKLLENDKPFNLEVIKQDVMQLNLNSFPKGYKVVANIPYYLTSAIFRLFLSADNRPSLMSVLIQKEVARRITAKPGDMSILALSVQYYGHPEYITTVEKEKFWPSPKVDSAVLKIEVFDKPVFEADHQKLFRLIKAGFGEKRKMLKNSLAGGLNLEAQEATQLIAEAKLAPNSRAQELALADWERLYRLAIKKNYI